MATTKALATEAIPAATRDVRSLDQASRRTLTNRHVEDATAIEQLTRIHTESAVARRNQVVRLRSVPAAQDGPEKTATGT